MSWSHCGTDEEGREIGYGIEAICDEEGYEEEIDRGLYFVCGDMHGRGEWGCGRCFCAKHLFIGPPEQLCGACCDAYVRNSEEEKS